MRIALLPVLDFAWRVQRYERLAVNGILTTTGDLVLVAVYLVPVTDVHTATYLAEPDQPLIFEAAKLTFNPLSFTEIFMSLGACGRFEGIS